MISSPWNLNIGNLSVCFRSEMGKLRWLVFQNTPKMAVPWEAPNPLTCDLTVLKHINYTQKTSGEELCEGRSAEYWKLGEPRSPTWTDTCMDLKVRHVPWRRLCFSSPAPEGCNPSFFCNEPRLKIRKSAVQVQRGLRGVTVPHCTSTCLPLAHTWSWENTQISHHEGRRIPFYNFFFK